MEKKLLVLLCKIIVEYLNLTLDNLQRVWEIFIFFNFFVSLFLLLLIINSVHYC